MKKTKRNARTYSEPKKITKEDMLKAIGRVPEEEPRPMTSREFNALVDEAKKLVEAYELVKEYFKRVDQVTTKLSTVPAAKLAKSGVALVDQFEGNKNTAWRSTPFRRYELKVVK